ncbi:MAG: LPS export ABC transporter periplasmic protein LptC [Bauldia sp.]|nr:LPS export ABC transporter periplasmic protein LptC [Bauldia sp.]
MRRLALLGFVALLAAPAPAATQSSASDIFSGFQAQSNDPIEVNSETLEVYEEGKQRITVFSGGVTVRRGKTTLKAATITLYSELEATSADAFTRIEAAGKIWVNSGDQTVTGANAIVDMKSKTITVSGGVVLTQGSNILTGTRLVVNLATGRARVEGSTRGVFLPGSANPLQAPAAN